MSDAQQTTVASADDRAVVARQPPRRSAWGLLLAVHVPFVVFIVAQGAFSLARPDAKGHELIALVLIAAATAIQLRHSAAAAVGTRPRGWPWSLALLVALVYFPVLLFGTRWMSLQWFLLASFAMLLPTRVAVVASVTCGALHALVYAAWWVRPRAGLAHATFEFVYWTAMQFLGMAGLYGSTQLVRLSDALQETRAELADLAIGRERLRIARDLHDLLGQSLAAVSLKGDLAIRLLERRDVPRAVAEIESLTAVARTAVRDVQHVAHGAPPIDFASEVTRAAELLASTGTDTRVAVDVDRLAPAADELLAWAVREGAANVLRHSSATTCTIRVARGPRALRLEMMNDGAMPASGAGSGLRGLATRAVVHGGTAHGRSLGGGRFLLVVELPAEVPVGVPDAP